MANIADINLSSPKQLSGLLEFGRDYCSDHLGSFFQNNYSPTPLAMNKFEIPIKLATRNEKDCFAICVIISNHIVDLKYFGDIFFEWDSEIGIANITSDQSFDSIDKFTSDQRLISIIKGFMKIDEEIVIGRCRDLEFTPI